MINYHTAHTRQRDRATADRATQDGAFCFWEPVSLGKLTDSCRAATFFPARSIQISGSGPWSAFTNADLGSGFWDLGSGVRDSGRATGAKSEATVAEPAATDAETGVWKSGGGGLEFWKVSARWSSHRLTFVALAAGGWWLVAGRTVWLVKIFSTDLLRLDANF